MIHRGIVLTTGLFTHVPTCSCGFVGINHQDKGSARISLNHHIVTALRNQQLEQEAKPLPAPKH